LYRVHAFDLHDQITPMTESTAPVTAKAFSSLIHPRLIATPPMIVKICLINPCVLSSIFSAPWVWFDTEMLPLPAVNVNYPPGVRAVIAAIDRLLL
jgi:hypothetical protein